ncbi:MAG TPA: DUF6134 family protein [Gammaproteobacteria bacterium]
MKNRLRILGYSILGCLVCIASTQARANTQEWEFRVFLDDREIGNHNFTVTDFGDDREVRTEAEFDVKILFFNAYQYRHRNTERWDGRCLDAIESETNANGDRYSLVGAAEDSAFVLSKAFDDDQAEVTLPDCVTTFAYWDLAFLEQPRLLNTQTGEYVDIEVELVGEDLLTVRGERVPTYRYRLTGPDLYIELWYSMDLEWLALESVTDGGRRLRYELI